MKIRVYEVSGVDTQPDATKLVQVTKPADVLDQLWDYRKAAADEKRGGGRLY